MTKFLLLLFLALLSCTEPETKQNHKTLPVGQFKTEYKFDPKTYLEAIKIIEGPEIERRVVIYQGVIAEAKYLQRGEYRFEGEILVFRWDYLQFWDLIAESSFIDSTNMVQEFVEEYQLSDKLLTFKMKRFGKIDFFIYEIY